MSAIVSRRRWLWSRYGIDIRAHGREHVVVAMTWDNVWETVAGPMRIDKAANLADRIAMDMWRDERKAS